MKDEYRWCLTKNIHPLSVIPQTSHQEQYNLRTHKKKELFVFSYTILVFDKAQIPVNLSNYHFPRKILGTVLPRKFMIDIEITDAF